MFNGGGMRDSTLDFVHIAAEWALSKIWVAQTSISPEYLKQRFQDRL